MAASASPIISARRRAGVSAPAAVAGPRQAGGAGDRRPSNAPWCSPTTTAPASCSPLPPAPTSTATASLPGKRAVVCTNNDSAYRAALDLRRCRRRGRRHRRLRAPSSAARWPHRPSARHPHPDRPAVTATTAPSGVDRRRRHAASTARRRAVIGAPTKIDCDLSLMSGGWNPAVHLFSQSARQAALRRRAGAASCPALDRRRSSRPAPATATFTWPTASPKALLPAPSRRGGGLRGELRQAPAVPATEPRRRSARSGWCRRPTGRPRQGQALRRFPERRDRRRCPARRRAKAMRSVEHVKRYTTNGMAHRPGQDLQRQRPGDRRRALGTSPIPQVGTTTFRPPYTPVTFGALAGRDSGELFDPARAHADPPLARSARRLFEDVGQWKRPWYFPQGGEDMHAAVRRECARRPRVASAFWTPRPSARSTSGARTPASS